MYDFYHNQANRRRRIIKVASLKRLSKAAAGSGTEATY
jgi:hypothetical protein